MFKIHRDQDFFSKNWDGLGRFDAQADHLAVNGYDVNEYLLVWKNNSLTWLAR
jgi:hypothetical protein